MPLEDDFERIVGRFARHTGGVEEMREDHAASKAMIARAEYELQQLQRDLASVQLEPLLFRKAG